MASKGKAQIARSADQPEEVAAPEAADQAVSGQEAARAEQVAGPADAEAAEGLAARPKDRRRWQRLKS